MESNYDTTDPYVVHENRYYREDPLFSVPSTNSASKEVPVRPSRKGDNFGGRFGVHVLFNMVGSLLRRYNKPIDGTIRQKHIVQSLVSTVFGVAFPVLFLQAMLFPKHFWCSAPHDPMSVLGCRPISCYRGSPKHGDGYASSLETARMLCTHASSSTSTDDKFTAHLWDMQANIAGSGYDSRVVRTAGFRVDAKSASGLQIGECDKASLSECMESSQALMNLAAASVKRPFDCFLTYTGNQRDHPGLGHLWRWKESQMWKEDFVNFDGLCQGDKDDVIISMEMAYSQVLTRCWLEVKSIWIDFIVNSTSTILRKVVTAFFRDEYQDGSGNPCHIHGLVGLDREDLSDEDFLDFVCTLQKNCVGDLVGSHEVESFIESGLLRDQEDWRTMQSTAFECLPHTCSSKRCLVKTGPRKGQHFCKTLDVRCASKNPLEHEFQNLPVHFSDECLDILERVELYTPPTSDCPRPQFHHPMFVPKRHVGVIHPQARERMSPVVAEHFAFTRSSQNYQVITGTGGVTRYVVKVNALVCCILFLFVLLLLTLHRST